MRRKGGPLHISPTEKISGLDPEPTTLLINPTDFGIGPAPTPPNGLRLVVDVRRLAHSVNNFLVPLMTAVATLGQDQLKASDRVEAQNEANESIERIRQLMRTYMGSNRPSRLDLSALAFDVSKVFDDSLRARRIRLVVQPSENVEINAPMAEVSDALSNLITNAADAMPNGGILVIRTSVDTACGDELGSKAVLEVTDTGCGMTPALMSQAFVTTFTNKPEGHGIGLPTISAIMHSAKGRIKITSRVGYGTSIQLRFPTASAT